MSDLICLYIILEQQQQQTSVRIPVRFSKNDSPANLIDFDQKTDKIRLCIICKRNFNDLSSTGLCSECDYKKKPSPITRTVVIKQSPPTTISPSTNLVDFEQKTDQIRPCIVCKRYFEDLSLTGLCSDCNYQRNPSTTRHVTIRRAPVTNTYSNSDFLTPHSSSVKIRGPLKIVCPYCRVLNLINTVQYGSNSICSACKRVLSV